MRKKLRSEKALEKDIENFSIEKIRSITEEGKKKKRIEDFETVMAGIQKAASLGYDRYNLFSFNSKEIREMLKGKGFEILFYAGSTYVKW